MERLVVWLVWLRGSGRCAGPLCGVALLGLVAMLHAAHPLDPIALAAFALVLGARLALSAWRRFAPADDGAARREGGSRRTTGVDGMVDLELGALLVIAAVGAAAQLDRSLDGPAHALVYLAVALTSAFARPAVALATVGVAVLLELGARALEAGRPRADVLAAHAAFALVFALLNAATLRLEVRRLRGVARRELEAERQRAREDAQSYRLLRAPLPSAPDEHTAPPSVSRAHDEERLLRSGLDQIHEGLLLALRMLRQCLGAHTAALLWLNDAGTQLRVAELVSDEPEPCVGPFAAHGGVLGAALAQQSPLALHHLKASYPLPFYRGASPVGALCAVPVREGGMLRGLLVVDRRGAESFTDADVALVEQAARFAARAIENERVFVQLERTKVEQTTLYHAAERLGAAITAEDVVEAGVSSAREIATVDFAAFTALDGGTHQIRAVSGEGASALLGRSFSENTGLCSMALRNRHPLPWRGQYDPSHQVVFAKGLAPPAMPSLLVLPLVVHDTGLGTLVLGSRQPGAFGGAARGLLEVLASHMAVSLSNARMLRRLEEQATTDALTGLLNKRALLATAEQRLSAAKRFGRRLSVLVSDIDHFKAINDTHGHPFGDVVIRELGQIHRRTMRTTDAVARFGGEEFVAICEETDAAGALLLAERIRAEFQRTAFTAGGETLHFTCSVGIATFPDAGASWDAVFQAADAALYASKRAGRNRATVHTPRGRGAAA
jgi:diguanylate cyclase (GGDEF)-like protein